MLAFIQFPIADLRRFAPPEGPPLSRPEWPPRIDLGPYGSFTRHFGAASRRHRGPDQAWLDEKSYYGARRAVSFRAMPGADAEPALKHCACAFRRLFFDGKVVARVEVGISYDDNPEIYRYQRWDDSVHAGAPPERARAQDPRRIIDSILKLPCTVPDPYGKAGVYRPLGAQGPSLARLFEHATASLKGKAARSPLVLPGAPLVIMECAAEQIDALPAHFTRVAPERVQDVKLAFGRIPFFGGELGVWFASYEKARFAQMRSLRVCLSRLHAEDQALQEVLHAYESGLIAYDPDADESDTLDAYLGAATAYLDRSRFQGIEQSAILEAIEISDAPEAGGDTRLLAQRLDGVRRQIYAKVEKYQRRARLNRSVNIYRQETYMDNRTINIGDGNTINAPIVIADHIESSFNTVAKSPAAEPIKDVLKELLTNVSAVDATQYPDKAVQLAQDARTLTEELSSKAPRRKWYELSVEGLTQAAQDIGQVGEAILTTVGKLAPLTLGLFKP